MAPKIGVYRNRGRSSFQGSNRFGGLIPEDDLGRTVVPAVKKETDWVMVVDDRGKTSYIPRCHLGKHPQPVINMITYGASLIYLFPLFKLIMGFISSG